MVVNDAELGEHWRLRRPLRDRGFIGSNSHRVETVSWKPLRVVGKGAREQG